MSIIPIREFKKLRMNLNKIPLTKENLNKFICDTEVYSTYTGQEIHIQSAVSSPFREDNNPSFGYFIGNSGEICWKDFALSESGDYISFVKKLFDLNFNQALIKLVKDFGLENEFEFKDIDVPTTKTKIIKVDRDKVVKTLAKDKKISIKKRKAEMHDIQFWLDFGITKKTLIKYNVTPIKYYFINGHIIKTDKYSYAFIEYKDGKETYKIYQPFSEDFKWINNHDESVWQGWEQLPEKGEQLIITKSLKDVMSISEVLKIPAVALQSETVKPKDKIVEQLYRRFDDIFILYDNDFDKKINWGQVASKELADYYGFYQIMIQNKWKSKDFSDLVKNHGAIKAYKLWEDEICLPY